MAQISKACCTLPPAQAGPYEPKGKYVQAGGLKTYVVGPASSAKAIFILYDIFGFSPQILQGADIVASAGYTVFMPDFFVGRYAEAKWFGPNLSEKEEQEKGAFFGYISDFPKYLGQLQSALTDLKKEYSSVKQFGGFGYCWGGKMVAATSGEGSPWTVGVQTSPFMLDAKDAEKITIPQMVLASADEESKDVTAFEKSLKTDHIVETFPKAGHGFMSARAQFNETQDKTDYERGYQMAVDFFNKHLE